MVATVPFVWAMGRIGLHKKSCEYSERNDALETRWPGPTDFPRTDTASHMLVPAPGTLTTAIAKSAIALGAGLEQHDQVWMEVRSFGVERHCEKDPLERKNVPRTVQSSPADALTQTDLNFEKGIEAGASSRLQGPPPPTRAPILEELGPDGTTDRVEDQNGRTDIVHKHFKELSWQRWTYEVQQSLPTIDGQRVREAAHAFRKRTSCVDDHLVIDMLRELDEDVRNIRKMFPVQTAEPLDGGSGRDVGKTAGHNGQEKERQTHTEKVSARLPCCRQCTGCTRKCCNSWRARQSTPGMAAVRSCPWPPSP